MRWACLAAAVLLALGGPLPDMVKRMFPSLSPLTLCLDSITQRRWYAGVFWGLPALAVLAVAVARGRFLCRWICPAGTVYAAAEPIALRKPIWRRKINGVLFWTLAAGALAGFPLFLGLDPLSSFNRMTPLLRGWHGVAVLIPGLVVPLFLVLSAIQPQLWCTHFCPLGYLFDLVRLRPAGQGRPDRVRRDLVIGLAVGVPLAVVGRRLRLVPPLTGEPEWPVLPPGARPAMEFAALCTRCYACVNACPTGVIGVGPLAGRPVGQWFQPELNTLRACCEEFCTACTQVCPAGAIVRLTEDEKRHRRIGTAVIIREACLAWEDQERCTVCDEYCPYHAIEFDESEEGIPRPIVNEAICRGCGACSAHCPAVRAGCAIVIRGAPAQGVAKDYVDDPASTARASTKNSSSASVAQTTRNPCSSSNLAVPRAQGIRSWRTGSENPA